jgi:hypothetical protein
VTGPLLVAAITIPLASLLELLTFMSDTIARPLSHKELAISVTEAFQLFLIALGDDPHAPVGCFRLIMGCTVVYNDAEDQYRHMGAPQTAPPDPPPELLSSFMRFLVAYRTRDDVERVLDRLFLCQCATGPQLIRAAPASLHSQDEAYTEKSIQHLGDLLKFMFDAVCKAFEKKLKPASLHREPNRDDAWPRVWEDLFPYDPSICIHALGAWHYLDLWTIFDGAGPLLRFLTDSYVACLMKGLLKSPSMMHWLVITQDACKLRIQSRLDHRLEMEPLDVLHRLQDLEQLMRIVRNISDFMFDDELLLWAQNVTKDHQSDNPLLDFVRRLNEVITLTRSLPLHNMDFSEFGGLSVPKQMINEILETAVSTAARMCIIAPQQLQGYRPHPDIRKRSDMNRSMLAVTPKLLIVNHIAFRWRHRCHGPECILTTQDLRRSFKACSGCYRSHYCSRECQRKAWHYQAAPHRDACIALRKLRVLEKSCKEDLDIIKSLMTSVPRQRIEAANRHLDTIHKSQYKVMCK